MRLKGGIAHEKNLFDTFYVVGHVDLVKIPKIDDVYLIATVKKYFPPATAFNQGVLVIMRFKKDGSTDVQAINEDSPCEYFQVVQVGDKSFFVLSIHS